MEAHQAAEPIVPTTTTTTTTTNATTSTVEGDAESSQIQVPRSRGNTPQSSQTQVNHAKYTSPPSYPASSLTPPPSTQQNALVQSIARTPSPVAVTRDYTQVGNQIPTPDQIAQASTEDLRLMMSSLCITLRDYKTDIAHYRLQYHMLNIDANKAKDEMTVELAMLQRELDVLHEAEERRRATSPPRPSIEAGSMVAIQDLHRQNTMLQGEIEQLRTALTMEKRAMERRDVRIASLEEQNSNLRLRIRQKRDHMNEVLDNVFDRSPTSVMNTPSRHSYYATPRRGVISTPARQPERRDNMAFDALLQADKFLSQETATAPSTPRNQGRSGKTGHVRNTHSLSSLPSTPNRRIQPSSQTLRTPLHLSQILEPVEPPASAPQFPISRPGRRRRASSDSTISAASDDEHYRTRPGASSQARLQDSPFVDDIPESSASQAATSMLRSTPSKQRKQQQSRIVGKVSKPGISSFSSTISVDCPVSPEKRRMVSGVPGPESERQNLTDASPKKRRVDHVGLGIGIS